VKIIECSLTEKLVQECISELILSLKKKELIIFCGAGISRDSGLPLTNQMEKSILRAIFNNINDSKNFENIHEIMKLKLRLEVFMEAISENTDISKILNVFKGGKPNTNHIIIAKLAKKGFLKKIVTTNFDLLIEKALEKEGLIKNVDFKVYYKEKHFSEIDFSKIENDVIKIFKIHGSAEDKKSIRTTVKAIAHKNRLEKRMNLMRYLFSRGNEKKVIFLGYSCSDDFDIIPQINSITENQKKIIIVDHSKIEEIFESVKTKKFKNPFANHDVIKIKYNTNKFIERFWSALINVISEGYQLDKSEYKWTKYISDWGEKIRNDRFVNYFIISSIFDRGSKFKKAIKYNRKMLEINKKINDMELELKCYTNLGTEYAGLGYFNKANYYNYKAYNALRISKYEKNEKKERMSKCLMNIGNAYHSLRKNDRAIQYHSEALKLCKGKKNGNTESKCLMNIGLDYEGLNKLKKANHYLKIALEKSIQIGDKNVESTCLENIGHYFLDSKGYPKAYEYYDKALQIYKYINDEAGICSCYIGKGAVFFELGHYVKSIHYYNVSLKVNKKLGNNINKAKIFINLGAAYEGKKDFKTAIKYYNEALKIEKENKNYDKIPECYIHLGVVHFGTKKFQKSIDFHKKALRCSLNQKNKSLEKICYNNIGYSYHKLKKFSMEIKYYKKALHKCKKIYSNNEISKYLLLIGKAYFDKEDFKNSIKYFKMTLVSKNRLSKTQKADCYLSLGAYYYQFHKFENAISYCRMALQIISEIDDKTLERICYQNLFNAYKGLKKYGEAKKYYKKFEKKSEDFQRYSNIFLNPKIKSDYESDIL